MLHSETANVKGWKRKILKSVPMIFTKHARSLHHKENPTFYVTMNDIRLIMFGLNCIFGYTFLHLNIFQRMFSKCKPPKKREMKEFGYLVTSIKSAVLFEFLF